jgi:hypothetical protein
VLAVSPVQSMTCVAAIRHAGRSLPIARKSIERLTHEWDTQNSRPRPGVAQNRYFGATTSHLGATTRWRCAQPTNPWAGWIGLRKAKTQNSRQNSQMAATSRKKVAEAGTTVSPAPLSSPRERGLGVRGARVRVTSRADGPLISRRRWKCFVLVGRFMLATPVVDHQVCFTRSQAPPGNALRARLRLATRPDKVVARVIGPAPYWESPVKAKYFNAL